jgi:hypothetical protein
VRNAIDKPHDAARPAQPLDVLIQQAAAAVSLRLVSGTELDARARAALPLSTFSAPCVSRQRALRVLCACC